MAEIDIYDWLKSAEIVPPRSYLSMIEDRLICQVASGQEPSEPYAGTEVGLIMQGPR